MKFGSLFSGIGGFDLGFERAGMTAAWQCEIDKQAQDVLRRQFSVEVYNDVRTIGKDAGAVDLICGGFPCQDLSIAGKRKGLAGERSGLWFEFHRIIAELTPGWVVIENVPGLLSSNGGRDFAVILRGLGELGYLSSWRILDAQYFGVPQRRRRVFIVASLGSGRAAEVLFESEGVPGDNPPSREAGQEVASTLRSGAGMPKHDADFRGRLVTDVAKTLSTKNQRIDWETETFVTPMVSMMRESGQGYWMEDTVAGTLDSNMGNSGHGNRAATIGVPSGVRRLTPTECARLQGFPDDWNAWLSDTVRYRQFGNAVAVPVAEWIGKRIMEVQS